MELISVIIPTYRSATYLKETIDSVLAQSYPYFELLCIDDASPDTTVDIIKSYCAKDARVRLIQHPKNLGRPAFGRNTGLLEATGEYVAFLDHDDLFEPQKLERQLASLHHQNVDFLCSNIYLLNHRTGKKDMLAWGTVSGDPIRGFLPRLLESNFVPPASTLIRRSVFKTVGLFDTSLVGVDDYDMWYRIARVFSASIINEPLGSWRYANSASISSDELIMLNDEIHFYEKIITGDIKAEGWEKEYAQKGVLRDHWLLANRYLSRGDYSEANKHYALAGKDAWAKRVMRFPWALRALYYTKRKITQTFSPLTLNFPHA